MNETIHLREERVSTRLRLLARRVDSRLGRFLLVGASGVGVSTAVLWMATRGVGLSTIWAGVLASVLSTGSNFLLNDAFTWRDRRVAGRGPWFGRMARYYVTTIVGNAIYIGMLWALVHRLRLFDLLANLVAIGTGGMFNYLIHNFWTWRRGTPR